MRFCFYFLNFNLNSKNIFKNVRNETNKAAKQTSSRKFSNDISKEDHAVQI